MEIFNLDTFNYLFKTDINMASLYGVVNVKNVILSIFGIREKEQWFFDYDTELFKKTVDI